MTRRKPKWKRFEEYVEKRLKILHPNERCIPQKRSTTTGYVVDNYCICTKKVE
ncbi:MAG: hypothetical protein NWE91_00545 [Candidatus Bathyarchaeota archaeon]|nr:hypothetical protein [Candidatus Bathyarchaeota archaeon]